MIRDLEDTSSVDDALRAERAVIYKHSPICWQSALAIRQVRRFAEDNRAVPVYMLDVLARRDLSAEVARRLQIGHESPQVIVLREGTSTWSASHFGVRAKALAHAVEEAGSKGTR